MPTFPTVDQVIAAYAGRGQHRPVRCRRVRQRAPATAERAGCERCRAPGPAAGTPAAWVTGDEVYGADPGLRADLERRRIGYMLAVAASHRVATAAGPCQACQLAVRLPRRAWQRYSAGEGAKGHRYYDWAWLAIDPGRPGHRRHRARQLPATSRSDPAHPQRDRRAIQRSDHPASPGHPAPPEMVYLAATPPALR